MQAHATECGAACLGSVLGYFGRWLPFGELRQICGVSRDGSDAASLARAAKRFGLECTGYRLTGGQIRGLCPPLILFWEFRHFVVLEGWRGDRYYLNDPGVGRRTVTRQEFLDGFAGVALQCARGAGFRPGGKEAGPEAPSEDVVRRKLGCACRLAPLLPGARRSDAGAGRRSGRVHRPGSDRRPCLARFAGRPVAGGGGSGLWPRLAEGAVASATRHPSFRSGREPPCNAFPAASDGLFPLSERRRSGGPPALNRRYRTDADRTDCRRIAGCGDEHRFSGRDAGHAARDGADGPCSCPD